MKRLTGIMLAVLVLGLSATAIAAHRTRAIVMMWGGTYVQDDPSLNLTGNCPASGCVGDLVTCGPSEVITITKKRFSFVSRVCSDRLKAHQDRPWEFPPCDGRITALVEECAAPDDVVTVGELTTTHSTGKMRVCMDGGDCTGASPPGVIQTMTTRTQTRSVAGSQPDSGSSQVVGRQTKFDFDGNSRWFHVGDTYVNLLTIEPNDGTNCGGEGCGVAAVGVTDRR
jgi:hypothetical protein